LTKLQRVKKGGNFFETQCITENVIRSTVILSFVYFIKTVMGLLLYFIAFIHISVLCRPNNARMSDSSLEILVCLAHKVK